MPPLGPPLPRGGSPLSPLSARQWKPLVESSLRSVEEGSMEALASLRTAAGSALPAAVAREVVGELRVPRLRRLSVSLTWRGLTTLLAAALAALAAHQALLPVAIIPLATVRGWDVGQQGLLLAASFCGQLASQVAGGMLADSTGGRLPLTVGVLGSCLATLASPVAAARGGRGGLLAARIVLGVAQGVAAPAVQSLLAAHCPPSRQSTAAAGCAAAQLLGIAAVFGLVPGLLAHAPWHAPFYIAGSLAMPWLLPWAALRLGQGARPPAAGAGLRAVERAVEPGGFAALWRRLTRSIGAGAGTGPASARDGANQALAPIAEEDAGRGAWAALESMATSVADRLRFWEPKETGPLTAPPTAPPISPAAWSGVQGYRLATARPLSPGLDSGGAAIARDGAASDDAASDAGTEWSDGVATGYRARMAAAPAGPAALLRQREVWAICVAQFASSWGAYGLLSWLPSYFREAFGVELGRLGGFAVLPFAVPAVVGLGAGAVTDRLLARGWPVARVRRGLQAAGMLGPAACLAAAAVCSGPRAAAAWITLGSAAGALGFAGAGANHLDVAPRHAGTVWGAGSTAATAAGLLAVPVSGFVLEATGSWAAVLALTAANYALGAGVYWAWAGGEALVADGGL